MNPKSQQSGMALILVILVLSALVVIGTPFVLSMKLQEQGAVSDLARKRADLAAISARNHAVATLMQTHPSRELDGEGGGDGGEGSLRWDAAEEIDVEIADDLVLSALGDGGGSIPVPYVMRGWDDRIIDVRVEDEQGKVNLNTAFPNLIGNLLGGSQLSEAVSLQDDLLELPLVDTSPFPADDDPHTVDGVVAILNPMLLTFEAVSYRGKTDTHLTGCFRGEYLSAPLEHGEGFPVFDIRGIKVYLHRYYDLAEGELRTFRTPQAIREIADWSIVPYFLQNLALLGLNLRNMDDFGLTPQLLARAGLDEQLMKRDEEEVDEQEYRDARKKLLDKGIPLEGLRLLEDFRGKGAIVQAGELIDSLGFEIGERESLAIKSGMEMVKGELKKIQKRTQKYFPKAIESYKELAEVPGLETFTAEDFDELRDLITTTSSVVSEWSPEQIVVDQIQANPVLGFPVIPLQRTDWFNPGTLVRIRSNQDPSKVEYQLAGFGNPNGMGGGGRRGGGGGGRNIAAQLFQAGVMLKAPLRYKYERGEAMVSALMRHPVNVNTAPRKVLEAVFTGLRTFSGGGRRPRGGARSLGGVTPKEARDFVDFLFDRMPIQGFPQFRELVIEAQSQGIIESTSVEAILLNAANPNNYRLIISTTGLCFTTGDVYTVESTGIINNSAGVELASARRREVIEIAPPDTLRYRIDDQMDWAFRTWIRPVSDRTQSNRTSWASSVTQLPGARGNLMITQPRPLFFTTDGRGFVPPVAEGGSLKALSTELETSRAQNHGWGRPTWGPIQHFADTIEGEELAAGAFTMSTLQQAQQGVTPPAGQVANTPADLITQPGVVEFWVKPNWGNRSGDKTFFDTLADPSFPDKNRIRLYYDGGTSELVFQIMDDAGLQLNVAQVGRQKPPAAEIRHRVNAQTFANDTWYHVTAVWGSTHPGDQALFIDQRPVGKNTWVTDLAGQLAPDTMIIRVKDADIAENFPPVGTLLVGTEAVDYDQRNGGTFRVRRPNPNLGIMGFGRGARGTVRQAHPVGTTVRLLGYSVDIAPSDPRFDLTTGGDLMLIGTAGANQAHEVLPSRRPVNGAWVPSTYATVNVGDVFPADQLGIVVQDDPIQAGFPQSGYLHMYLWVQTNASDNFITSPGYEYVKYSRIQAVEGGGFAFTGIGRNMNILGSQLLSPALINNVANWFIRVRSVSIETNVNDLSSRYPPSGVLQLEGGNPNAVTFVGDSGFPPQPSVFRDVEWVRYRAIAEDRYFIGAPHNDSAFRGFTGDRLFSRNNPAEHGDFIWDANAIWTHPSGQHISQVVRPSRPVVDVGDWVTIADSAGAANQRQFEPTPLQVRKSVVTDVGTYVSFQRTQRPTFSYFVRGNPKMKRFPSGEPPTLSSGELTFGRPAGPAVAGEGGVFEGLLDEVRLSRAGANDVNITAYPLPRGRIQTFELQKISGQPTDVKYRAIRTFYRKSDTVESGGDLDRVLLLGQSRLEVVGQGANVTRAYTAGHPRSFGLGRREGLLALDGEVLHYSDFDAGQVEQQVRVKLAQDLPRDHLAVDDVAWLQNGIVRFIDPRRDLRAEVVNSITLDNTNGLPPRDGFLEFTIDEQNEILYYEYKSGNQIFNVLRGQLGTGVGSYQWTYFTWNGSTWVENFADIWLRLLPKREVDLRTREMLSSDSQGGVLGPKSLRPLPHIAVTRTTGVMTDEAIPVLDTSEFGRQPGYLIADDGNVETVDEIIGYQRTAGDHFLRSRDGRTLGGLFRGRFGTDTTRDIGTDQTLVQFPARYHDHYQAQVESPDLQYYERQIRVPGAHWDLLTWEEQEQRNRTFKNEVRVLVRFDGVPAWDEKPTNKPGGLYLITNPDKGDLDVQADLMEFRVFFRYPVGAYGRISGDLWADDWKASPVMDSIEVEYRKPWRVVHREDLPY